jgi:hypothetical protein
MRSNTVRAAIGLGAIAVIVVLFVVLNGGNDNKRSDNASTAPTQTTGGTAKPAAPQTQTVLVRAAAPVGGVKKLEYNKGDRVSFVVDSDTADEIHVHGYNFMKDVPAGGRVRFDFPAKIDGIFVIELENHGTQIAELQVNP